jgi:hypothetical protein
MPDSPKPVESYTARLGRGAIASDCQSLDRDARSHTTGDGQGGMQIFVRQAVASTIKSRSIVQSEHNPGTPSSLSEVGMLQNRNGLD